MAEKSVNVSVDESEISSLGEVGQVPVDNQSEEGMEESLNGGGAGPVSVQVPEDDEEGFEVDQVDQNDGDQDGTDNESTTQAGTTSPVDWGEQAMPQQMQQLLAGMQLMQTMLQQTQQEQQVQKQEAAQHWQQIEEKIEAKFQEKELKSVLDFERHAPFVVGDSGSDKSVDHCELMAEKQQKGRRQTQIFFSRRGMKDAAQDNDLDNRGTKWKNSVKVSMTDQPKLLGTDPKQLYDWLGGMQHFCKQLEIANKEHPPFGTMLDKVIGAKLKKRMIMDATMWLVSNNVKLVEWAREMRELENILDEYYRDGQYETDGLMDVLHAMQGKKALEESDFVWSLRMAENSDAMSNQAHAELSAFVFDYILLAKLAEETDAAKVLGRVDHVLDLVEVFKRTLKEIDFDGKIMMAQVLCILKIETARSGILELCCGRRIYKCDTRKGV